MNEPNHAPIADDVGNPKQQWSAPEMTEVDAVAVTLAGGIAIADNDPNQPS